MMSETEMVNGVATVTEPKEKRVTRASTARATGTTSDATGAKKKRASAASSKRASAPKKKRAKDGGKKKAKARVSRVPGSTTRKGYHVMSVHIPFDLLKKLDRKNKDGHRSPFVVEAIRKAVR